MHVYYFFSGRISDGIMINLPSLQRFARRLQELGWPKSTPKRYGVFAGVLFIIFLYYLFSNSKVPLTALHKCVADEFVRKSYDIFHFSTINESISFIGNGFISLDSIVDKQLIINNAGIAPIFTGFSPLIELDIVNSLPKNEHFVSDLEEGMTKTVKCFIIVSILSF